jgi:hypothetical protein
MLPANKGDYEGLPLKPSARNTANAWDAAKNPHPAEDCRNFGAANLMRQPGRLHITWQDDQTLKIETDAGRQTRLLSFAPPQKRGGESQGVSQAAWENIPSGRGPANTGSLKIVTTRLKPGFLRSNGVPYSAATTLTEYFDRVDFPDGNSYLVLSTTVEDAANLTAPYLTADHFKKQADASGWSRAANPGLRHAIRRHDRHMDNRYVRRGRLHEPAEGRKELKSEIAGQRPLHCGVGDFACAFASRAPSLISSLARFTTMSPALRLPSTSTRSPSAGPFRTSTHSALPS